MPTYTDPVFIDGNQDDPQLRVQGHTTQTDPLQTWEDSGNNALARISGDGRLELGALNIAGAPSALIEANQNISTSSVAKQGFQSRGITSAGVTEPLTWSVHELELQGDGGVSDLETALRAKVTHSNTGNSQNGRLRAGDFHVVNQSGSSSQQVNEAVAVQATVTNSNSGGSAGVNKAIGVKSLIQNGNAGDVINEAVGFEVALPENTGGTINNFYGLRVPNLTPDIGASCYAIKTGQGPVQFGDAVDIKNANSSVEPVRLKIGDGAFLGGRTNWNSLLEFSCGAEYTSAGWIAKDTKAALISCVQDRIDLFSVTGLTPGAVFAWPAPMIRVKAGKIFFFNFNTPTPEPGQVYLDSNGFLRIG
jgi:hypothetical protein